MQPALEMLREREQKPAIRGEREDDRDQCRAHARRPQDPLGDERRAAAAFNTPLDQRERDDRDDAGHERCIRPQRPAFFVAQHQRHHEQQDRGRQRDQAREVEWSGAFGAVNRE